MNKQQLVERMQKIMWEAHCKGESPTQALASAWIEDVEKAKIEGFEAAMDALNEGMSKFVVVDPALMAWLKNERHKYVAILSKEARP
jgi:ABC-type amino acid transport substrate-binding protein